MGDMLGVCENKSVFHRWKTHYKRNTCIAWREIDRPPLLSSVSEANTRGGGMKPLQPTYFEGHPDGTYSVAEPQPILGTAAGTPPQDAEDVIAEMRAFIGDMRRDARDFHDEEIGHYATALEGFIVRLLAASRASRTAPRKVTPQDIDDVTNWLKEGRIKRALDVLAEIRNDLAAASGTEGSEAQDKKQDEFVADWNRYDMGNARGWEKVAFTSGWGAGFKRGLAASRSGAAQKEKVNET